MGSEVDYFDLDENLIESSVKEKPKGIQAIKKNDVHQICSGQVVLNLAIAVKELVENSLDAGATAIEVRLKEYGSKVIEVIDNGCGVEESNFQGLTLKHHTSKLQDFSDLISVETFGFRGEALSSLCALSEMTIITRHKDASCGSKLEFNHSGKIENCTPFSRQVGTSVTVCNLFGTLPVRQKEFHRNLKREFTKMTHLLFAYCLVSVNVKISCSNQLAKGGRTTVVCTQGCSTVRENISCVFGSKQVQSLVVVSNEEEKFSIEGHISSCSHGQGRAASDRQFYYINSRPCEHNKLMKLVNEVYRTYNVHQYPFVFLNVKMHRADVDVNVTPDKRQVFLEHEKELSVVIKALLLKIYELVPSTFHFQNIPSQTLSPKTCAAALHSVTPEHRSPKSASICPSSPIVSYNGVGRSPLSAMFNNWKHSSAKIDNSKRSCEDSNTSNDSGLFSYFKRLKKDGQNSPSCSNDNVSQNNLTLIESHDFNSDGKTISDGCIEIIENSSISEGSSNCVVINDEYKKYSSQENQELGVDYSDILVKENERYVSNSLSQCSQTYKTHGSAACLASNKEESGNHKQGDCCNESTDVKRSTCLSQDHCITVQEDSTLIPHDCGEHNLNGTLCSLKGGCGGVDQEKGNTSTGSCLSNFDQNCMHSISSSRDSSNSVEKSSRQDVSGGVSDIDDDISLVEDPLMNPEPGEECNETCNPLVEIEIYEESVQVDAEKPLNFQRQTAWCSVTLDDIRTKLAEVPTKNIYSDTVVRFRVGVDPAKNQSAEQELVREISKDMFRKMHLIGQFNLGFIITRLDQDLFIIDQHASDEKYNFETLQQKAALTNQRLVCPLRLDVSATGESVLLENIHIFRSNGFEFTIDEREEVTKKVTLTAIPVSRTWEFGKEDIDELIFMLQDAPGTMCRPSRVRAMFASRACRKSVMIGTALSKSEMRRLVNNMGTIEQPWNCPHGRPTMRHLVNLNLLQS